MARVALPSNYLIPGGSLVESFETLGDWTNYASSGTPTAESDTTNVRAGSAGLKLIQAATGNTSRYRYFASGLDLSAYGTFQLVVYAHNGYTASNTMNLYVSTGANGNFANVNYNTLAGSLTGTLKKGWNVLTFKKSDVSTVGGSGVTWSNVNNLRVQLTAAGAADAVTVDALYGSYRARTKIVLTMDDGPESQYDACVEANALDIPITVYPIRELVDGTGYLTTVQLQALYDAGNDIGLHDTNDCVTPEDSGAAQIAAARAFLSGNGWTRGIDHIAWPNGYYNPSTIVAAQAAGLKTARALRGTAYSAGPPLIYESVSTKGFEATGPGVANLYAINAINLNNGTTLTQAKDAVDEAIALGVSQFFYAHLFGGAAAAGTWTTSDWTALLAHLVLRRSQGHIDCPTITQWYAGLSGTRPEIA